MSNMNRARVMRQSASEARVRVAELSSANQQQDWQSALSALIATAAILVYFAIN